MALFNFGSQVQSDTVDSVLSAFSTQIDRLNKIAELESAKAVDFNNAANIARANAEASVEEANRASQVAQRIKNLIG